VACDATARLYDVDEDSVVFKRLRKTAKYDQATVTFRARKGRLVDLDKLHESIWATRLSRGTRSGLVNLQVTAIGEIVQSDDQLLLKISGSDKQFVLAKNSADEHAATFADVKAVAGANSVVRVTGRIDNYKGRWPSVLEKQPEKPRRVLVTGVEVIKP
jgi:hypothetical protein